MVDKNSLFRFSAMVVGETKFFIPFCRNTTTVKRSNTQMDDTTSLFLIDICQYLRFITFTLFQCMLNPNSGYNVRYGHCCSAAVPSKK